MTVTVTVDYTGFKAMCSDLAQLAGVDYAYVLKSEAASCVKIAALSGKIASLAAIRRNVEQKADNKYTGPGGEISINSKTSIGRVWFTQAVGSRAELVQGPSQPGKSRQRRVAKSGGYYLVFEAGPTRGHHLPNPIWNEYLLTAGTRDTYIRQRAAQLAQRRGIERQSWLQIADDLGIDLDSVAPAGNLNQDVVRAANVDGKQFKNGRATEQTGGASYTLVCTNDSPVAIKRSGQSRLDAAINQRVKGFQIALEKGLLDDFQRRAKRWPGIFISPA